MAYYGLNDLRPGVAASDQLPFIEGLLPLPETPLLLPSVGMPNGRVADLHFFTDDEATWVALLDVTPEHAQARRIQQKAYDMTLLSEREARLIAKLEIAYADLTRAHHELGESLLRTHRRLQRELRVAGHPSPILVSGPPDQPGLARPLLSSELLLGLSPATQYECEEQTLVGPARLFLFSDGVHEIRRPDDTMLPFSSFEEVLTRAVSGEQSELDELLQFARQVRGGPSLEDDFSIVRMTI